MFLQSHKISVEKLILIKSGVLANFFMYEIHKILCYFKNINRSELKYSLVVRFKKPIP